MDDATLVEQFENCTLPDLTHRDHVRLVFLYSRAGAAYPRIREGLINYTASRGSSSAFHETRTWAWAQLIEAAAAGHEGGFDDFWAQHPEFDRRDLLDDYYAPQVLSSDEARAAVVEPTLRAI